MNFLNGMLLVGGWLWTISWQVMVLALMVWGFVRVFRTMPAAACAFLWLLVMLKPLVPTSLSAPWGLGTLLSGTFDPMNYPLLILFFDPIRAWHGENGGLDVPNSIHLVQDYTVPLMSFQMLAAGLVVVWFIGMLAFLADMLRRQAQLAQDLKTGRVVTSGPVYTLYQEIGEELGLRRLPRLLLLGNTTTPFLCGLLRPTVVLPAGLPCEMTTNQLRMVLAHELIHFRRSDLIVCWLQSVIQSVFWFHPAIWLAGRELDLARELSVDAAVLELNGCTAAEYGESILLVAEEGMAQTLGVAAFLGNGGYTELEIRIRALFNPKHTLLQRRLAWSTVTVFALAVLPMGMPHRTMSGDQASLPGSATTITITTVT